MSPRPIARRDDATAAAFLDAGAALIDAMLVPDRSGPLPARLRQLHYPAPLDWIRIEDVLRIVGGSPQASRKAFYNRWPTKDDYIHDCFIHTLLYRDRDGQPLSDVALLLAHLTDASVPLTVRLRGVARGMASGLLGDPRASLLSHAAVMVNHDPETAQRVAEATAKERDLWRVACQAALDGADLVLRPDWTIDGLVVIVQMLIDGMVMSNRVGLSEAARDNASMGAALGDAFVAMLGSAVDWERSGLGVDAWINGRAAPEEALEAHPRTTSS